MVGAVLWTAYGAARVGALVAAAAAMRRHGSIAVADRLLAWRGRMRRVTGGLAVGYAVLALAMAGLG